MADVLKFDQAGLDVWTDDKTFEVTRERLVEYAKATNDPIPAHLAGDVASPVFAIVPVFESMLEPALDVVPLAAFGRGLHGLQDFRFHRPIKPGDKLVARGKAIGWRGLPNGTPLTIYLECRTEDGELVNEQYLTPFFRGVDAGDTQGIQAPDHKLDESVRSTEPVATVVQHVDDDQTYRYGPAAGDPVPLHLDDQIAKDAGLPGIIAHGLCMQAFTAWAVLTEVGDSDVTRLRRLAVRFAKPVLPGQDITTTIWRAGSVDGVTTYVYETKVGDTVVLKDGLAQIAD
ncbi:Dehydrogenases with different specificities (related to short-chain alcohol dehydrogenases) [Alloactinosynnema sp. L-07]|uniref:MaoC/PaaZ C-terminal domain-containing protein n=1 Tax=Alloactinosynnema sp. L-07 TaxID=1653480 RepID=UPI00065F0882|nr:MaoC/PaaZ C-terminal domain-containing protein [Alloactinosynnema sp. L-07]CRK56513.1 Dehydrogenases with different specificities (related to short-chain alcohol dehydrogenases) [Alloactinosynnema sp. L-07]